MFSFPQNLTCHAFKSFAWSGVIRRVQNFNPSCPLFVLCEAELDNQTTWRQCSKTSPLFYIHIFSVIVLRPQMLTFEVTINVFVANQGVTEYTGLFYLT